MGPDPYFNNVPKDQWPEGKDVKLTNTELFQSINPLFIVLLTLIFVPLFDYLRKRERTNHSIKIWNGDVYFRLIGIGNGICCNVCSFYIYT